MYDILAALSVTVGIQQTTYTIGEIDDYQLVCIEVLSGDIDGREIVFDYSTASGSASKHCKSPEVHVHMYGKTEFISAVPSSQSKCVP